MDKSEVTVRILFFGKARELISLTSSELVLPCSISKEDLFSSVESRFPVLRQLNGCFVLALDQEYLERDSSEVVSISSRSELAVIPPISGG